MICMHAWMQVNASCAVHPLPQRRSTAAISKCCCQLLWQFVTAKHQLTVTSANAQRQPPLLHEAVACPDMQLLWLVGTKPEARNSVTTSALSCCS
jgi:hypothetical protein